MAGADKMTRPVRLMKIVDFLARRPKTAREIAERFDYSERGAFRDIAELSVWLPIRKTKHGYVLLESATIRPLALTASERAVLRLVLENPAVRTTPDVGKTLRGVADKLDAATKPTEPIVETPTVLALMGSERSGRIPEGVLPLLEGAVRQRTPVSIHYRSLYGQRTTWRGLDPWKLFHREGAWYVIGRCHVRDEGRTFRLDRIKEARIEEGTFEPSDLDLDAALRLTWGLQWGRERHEVVLDFDPDLAPLIEEGVHHPDESIRRLDNGRLEYRVTLSHLNEIARWVVSFGGQARALEPPALVRMVADMGLLCHQRHAHAAAEGADDAERQQDLPGMVRAAAARQRSLRYDGRLPGLDAGAGPDTEPGP